jgi:uncharacterized protein YfaP (DUF2135 family)
MLPKMITVNWRLEPNPMKPLNLLKSRFFLALCISLSLMLTVLFFLRGTVLNAQPGSATVTVKGKIVFDTGQPVSGAKVKGTLTAVEQTFLPMIQRGAEEELDPEATEAISASGEASITDETITDANGDFTLKLAPNLPVKVLIEVSFASTSMPTIETAKLGTIQSDLLDMGTIAMPNPQGAEITISNGAGQNADGSVQVAELPATVNQLFGRAYDPDVNTEAFPGDFTESNQIPLNSSVFLWMEALDANGHPVDELAQAATVRSRIPLSQWVDLEDIRSGTNRIEIPIYTYNESTDRWEQMGEGWLEDASRTVLPEDAQPVILDGTFAGELFATFKTVHFSWMNVDYPYIGPWTLSRLSSDKRNNDCLYNAMRLARTIAMSAKGRAAYAKVNQPGASLDVELSDGNGPELASSNNPHPDPEIEYADYAGDRGGSETQFTMNDALWNGCGEGATDPQKKNTTLILAVTILHETAHWKDDVKKFPDDDSDTEDEEGTQLERDIFGGEVGQEGGVNGAGGKIEVDGTPISDNQRDQWLDPSYWSSPLVLAGSVFPSITQGQTASPLEVTISLTKTTFELGEEIPVQITYRNISTSTIKVMNRIVLEGWPLHFNLINIQTGTRTVFVGPERKLSLTDSDFTPLLPNETLQLTTNLLKNPTSGFLHYKLVKSGEYEVAAVYEGLRGVPRTTSNVLAFTLTAGGKVTGLVTSATTGEPISGTKVSALQNANLLDVATTGVAGQYTIPELPTGVYTFEVRAPGFLHSLQPSIQVTAEQTTTVNFSLSPLLATGEMRAVLIWGETPSDLDSHLWLPDSVPYHIYFSRRGDFEACPFAGLDVDDTSGLGPETMTIKQRYNTGAYVYAVHNYSGASEIKESQAQVQVFDATGLIATFTLPTEGTGRWWHVFNIDGQTGSITEVNQILEDNPEPYADTSTGCNPSALALPVPDGSSGKEQK